MMTGSKTTQVILSVVLAIALSVLGFCVAFKMNLVETDMFGKEFKPKGKTLEALADSVVKEVINDDMDDVIKYKVLHDWLINYAEVDTENKYVESESLNSGTVVLTTGKGTSESYAQAYQALCKSANLYCRLTAGNVGDKYKDHTWNVVRINNNFYHVDCLFDDTDKKDSPDGEQVYTYFLLSDKTLQKMRTFEPQGCSSTTYEGKVKK